MFRCPKYKHPHSKVSKTQKYGKYLNRTQSTSQANSTAPTKRFFMKMPVRLAPWARKRMRGTRGHERERVRARARTRARERERERETGANPPQRGIPNIWKQTLRKNIFKEWFCQIAKANFTKINPRRSIYRKLRIQHVMKNYAK